MFEIFIYKLGEGRVLPGPDALYEKASFSYPYLRPFYPLPAKPSYLRVLGVESFGI